MSYAHMPNGYYAVVFGILSMFITSFIGLIVDRGERKESIVSPPSHCVNCGKQLKFYTLELVPVIGYLVHGGKCMKCKSRVPVVYPIMEFLAGLFTYVYFDSFGLTPDAIIKYLFLCFFFYGAWIDYKTTYIPWTVLIAGYVLAGSHYAFYYHTRIPAYPLTGAAIMIVLGLVLWAVSFGRHGIGDTQIMISVAVMFGAVGSIMVFVMAGIFILLHQMLIFVIKRKYTPGTMKPFGPYLFIATAIISMPGVYFYLASKLPEFYSQFAF